MAAPTISLPVSGTAPNQLTSKELLEAAVNAALATLDAKKAEVVAMTSVVAATQVSCRDASLSWTGTTATVSWTQVRLLIPGITTISTIADLPVTELPSNQCIYVDLEAGTTPFTPIVATTSTALRNDFAAGRKLQLLYNQTGTLIGALADAVRGYATSQRLLAIEDQATWDQSEMVVEVLTTGRINIYQKSGPHGSAKYTRWRVDLSLIPDDDAGPGRASDVWRINGVYSHTRTGRWTFDYLRRLCTEGEFETAIRIEGASDYMGGATHGDEKKDRAYLRIDGRSVAIQPAAVQFYRCHSVEIIQATTLYRPDTTPAASDPVATTVRRHVWKNGEFTLCNRVEFSDVLNLRQSFLAMLPVERIAATIPAGEVITNNGQRDPFFLAEDLSAAGFPVVESKSSLYKLSGPLGYGFEVEILKGWERANRRSWIANPEAYNKVYFDVFGEGYLTTIGEVIETETRYRFMSD